MNGWNEVTHVTGTALTLAIGYDGLGDMVVRTNRFPPALTAGTTFSITLGSR